MIFGVDRLLLRVISSEIHEIMLALRGARTRQARFLLTTDNLQLPALRKEKTDQLRKQLKGFLRHKPATAREHLG